MRNPAAARRTRTATLYCLTLSFSRTSDNRSVSDPQGRSGTHFHGWEPVSINGGAEKYSVSVLIPKGDTATVNAINAAIEEGIVKFGGKKPNKAAIKLPHCDVATFLTKEVRKV